MKSSLRRWVRQMNKAEFTGWKHVLRFSFMQELNQKSYKIFALFLCLISLASMPLMTLINNATSEEVGKSEINIITVYDETGLAIDFGNALEDDRYTDVKIVDDSQVEYEAKVKELEEAKDSKELVIKISYNEEGYFDMLVTVASSTDLGEDDLDSASEDLRLFFNKAKLQSINVTEDQVEYMNKLVETRVETLSEEGEIIDEAGDYMSFDEYSIMFAGIMLGILLITFSGSQVANSVVTEKSTRVIEYLIINIRPMALLIGKVLASMALVFIQFALACAGILISMLINKAIFGAEAASVSDTFGDVMSYIVAVNPITIILSLITLLIGALLYSMFAGVVSASVSKMEQLSEGMKLFQTIAVIGSYMGLALCIMESSAGRNPLFAMICALVPISSPFVIPPLLLLGRINPLIAFISILIMITTTALLFILAARVYETLILYQGQPLSLKNIINIARNKTIENKEEA